MNNNSILEGLSKSAAVFVQSMESKLSSGYPSAIKDSIITRPPQSTETESSITVEVGKDAPMTRAFEYGSGIHRTRGTPGTYVIAPKAGIYNGLLAFEWPGHTKNFPRGRKYVGASKYGDKLLFNYVDHPGIAPKPFVRPSIEDSKAEIRKILGQSFKVAIMTGIPPVTVIEVK